MKTNHNGILAFAIGVLGLAAIASGAQPQSSGSCCPTMPVAQSQGQKTPAGVQAKEVKGIQKATVNIFGGYKPDVIRVKKGKPVELTFTRTERNGCGNVLVIDSLKVRREIAPGRSTVVKFTPTKTGEIPFECGMGMIRGKVVVQ